MPKVNCTERPLEFVRHSTGGTKSGQYTVLNSCALPTLAQLEESVTVFSSPTGTPSLLDRLATNITQLNSPEELLVKQTLKQDLC